MHSSETTRDHDTIRRWAEKRGGKPATVAGTERQKEDGGILRLDFDPPDEGLEPISWDEFFRKFDAAHLSFIYQEKTADGGTSRFHKFIHD